MSFQGKMLQRRHPQLTQRISALMKEAEGLKAYDGIQRMEFVCDQYQKLTPDIVYRLIDIESFQVEIEEVQNRHYIVHILHIIRNALSVAPLIVTWFALFITFQKYHDNLQQAISQAFTSAALIDIILLVLYLCFMLSTQAADFYIQRRASAFTKKLRAIIDEFIQVVVDAQFSPITSPEDVNKIALAVKQVIDRAIDESRQLTLTSEKSIQLVTTQAQKAIEASNRHMEELIKVNVSPLLKSFEANTKTFQSLLGILQAHVDALTTDVGQSLKINQSLLESVKANTASTNDFQMQVSLLQQGEHAILAELQAIVHNLSGSSEGTVLATEQIKQTSGVLSALGQKLEQSFQVVALRLDADETRTSQFLQSMLAFQKQLDTFDGSLQYFMQTSQDLGTNIGLYTNLGSEIHQQVQHLHTTEQGILTQFQTVSSDLALVVRGVGDATVRMQDTTTSVQQVATGMDQNMQLTIQALVGNIQRATASLGNVEKQLSHTANTLQHVATAFASLDIPHAEPDNDGGWVARIFSSFKRNYSQSKV